MSKMTVQRGCTECGWMSEPRSYAEGEEIVLDTSAHVCPPLTLREAMVKLYAEAMEDSAEGALRWLASRFEDRYGEGIPEPHDSGSDR